MLFITYNLDDDTINQIKKCIKKYKDEDVSKITHTVKGFQTKNILNYFNRSLLKKIIPFNKLLKKIFYLHYIKYQKGGYQKEHCHPDDLYSFIVYLNDSDGFTYFKKPINKKVFPRKGKTLVFDGKIVHYANKSLNEKQVLVGAIK